MAKGKGAKERSLQQLELLLREFLDVGVEDEELQQLMLVSVAERVRQTKVQIAQVVQEARVAVIMDNLAGSQQALNQAAQLKKVYHSLYAEWKRLGGEQAVAALEAEGEVEE